MGDYMNIHCRLGAILADLKAKYGKDYNAGNFAKRIGISSNTLSSYTHNNVLPKFEIAYRVARELQMPIEEIWVWVED